MFKLMYKKIRVIAILRKLILLNWPYELNINIIRMKIKIAEKKRGIPTKLPITQLLIALE